MIVPAGTYKFTVERLTPVNCGTTELDVSISFVGFAFNHLILNPEGSSVVHFIANDHYVWDSQNQFMLTMGDSITTIFGNILDCVLTLDADVDNAYFYEFMRLNTDLNASATAVATILYKGLPVSEIYEGESVTLHTSGHKVTSDIVIGLCDTQVISLLDCLDNYNETRLYVPYGYTFEQLINSVYNVGGYFSVSDDGISILYNRTQLLGDLDFDIHTGEWLGQARITDRASGEFYYFGGETV